MVRGDTSHGGGKMRSLQKLKFFTQKDKEYQGTTEEFEYQSLFLCLRRERCVKLFF